MVGSMIEMGEAAKEPYCVGIDKLKFFLIPFVCFNTLGFPGQFGGRIQSLSGFVAPCFFILCGFLVLSRDTQRRREKLIRAIKRAGLLFLAMLVLFVLANILYCSLQNIPWVKIFTNKKSLFYFLILNVWPLPMGEPIWFIQSLLYAYIFLLLINKWFEKLWVRRILLIVCVAFMLVTGEFAGLLGLKFFGASYLPAGMVTRALPYLLIGSLLREKAEGLFMLPPFAYPFLSVVFLALAYGEFTMLANWGILVDASHSIFLGLTAIALACWGIIFPEASKDFIAIHGRLFSKWIYASFQIVALGLILFTAFFIPQSYGEIINMGGVIVYVICITIAVVISVIKFLIWLSKNKPELEDL